MAKESDVELLFAVDACKKLGDLNCIPLKPNYLRANRSIIVKNVDRYIMELSVEELVTELNESNDHLKVTNVFKFPSGKTFKFECESAEMALNCLERGLLLLNLSISPMYLSLEESRDVLYCFKCYEINSHKSTSCPRLSDFKICSLCASENHIFENCESDFRKCLNCSGKHPSMSKACPKYKEAVASAPKKTVQSVNFGSNDKNLITPIPGNSHTKSYGEMVKWGLSREDMFRGFMSLSLATNMETVNPGSFDENLTKLLGANGLPSFATAGLVPTSVQSMEPANNRENPVAQFSAEKNVQTSIIHEGNSNVIEQALVINDVAKASSSGGNKFPVRSRNSVGFLADCGRNTRSHKCKIYVRNTEKHKLAKGGNLIEGINSRYVAVEHLCSDDAKCLNIISSKILSGDSDHLSITDMPHKKFEEKFKVLMGFN